MTTRIGAALRLLPERGWALGLVAVLAFGLGCLGLGQWQFGRHQDKVLRNQRIDDNYASSPVALPEVLAGPTTSLSPDRLWRPVRLQGRYLVGDTVVVRNRPFHGAFGYEVLVPLQLADGTAVMVDRGWIPNGDKGSAPDSVPAAPTGPVELVARLRLGEPDLGRAPIPGQASSIDLTELAQRLHLTLYQAYGVLAQESPAPSPAPVLLARPDEDLGPHLAYAVQWWAFALAGPVLFGRALDREAGLRAGPGGSGSGGSQSGGSDPRGPTSGGLRPATGSRRRRPSDEEYEDALTGG